jgi:outer membrane receptor for ferrienterochelin and colicins
MSGDRILPLCFAVALLGFPAGAKAETLSADTLMDLPLEKLVNVEVTVTSVSKYAEKISEAPSAVEVVTADDIRTYGYRTLGEALDGLHGLYAASDRNYNYLGVRGFLRPGDYNSRILVMVDGRRMNDNIYDSANTGQEFMLDMDLVERIEFIPGPGSSLYGANAMEGVINVISKKGADVGGVELAGGLGSFGTNTERATYGRVLENGADVLLSASRYYSGGPSKLFYPEFNDPTTNNGIAHDIDEEEARRLFGKVRYKDFTFTAGIVDRFKQVPIASFGSIFNDPGENSTDISGFGEIQYDKKLNDKTDVQVKAFYQGYYYDAHFPYDNDPGPLTDRIVNFDAADGRWAGIEANVVTSAFDRHKLVAGIEYQYDLRQRVYNYDISPYALYQDSNRVGNRAGIYAQDDYRLRDDLIISAGFRVDQNHMIDDLQFNPRLALIWNPLQTTTVKLLYGSAFRAPNIYERDLNTAGNAANPDNEEEHIRTYEGVVEWRPQDGVRLTGSVFNNDFTKVLTQDPVTDQFVNTGKFTAYGYELGAEKKWANGRSMKGSFDHTILHDETGGVSSWAVDSPKNVFKLLYSEPLFDGKAKLGLENVFVDARKTLQNSTASRYDLVNANLSSKEILPGADASFGVYNIFNAHPEMVGGAGAGAVDITQNVIPMNGRSVRLKLQYRF